MFTHLMTHKIRAFVQCDKGATAIEYGLIAALVGLSVVGGASATGDGIGAKFATISYHISGTVPFSGPMSNNSN